MPDERTTVVDYRAKGAGRLVFGSGQGVRRMGMPIRLVDVAREMFWPVILLAYWTLGVVWVLGGEMLHPGSTHGAWLGVVGAWVLGNAVATVRAMRLARAVRVIEVLPGGVVLRETGREFIWGRDEIAGVRRGPDYVGLDLIGPRHDAAAVLVSDLPTRELARAARWLREGLRKV